MKCSNCGKKISNSKWNRCIDCYRKRDYPKRTDIKIDNQKIDNWLRSQ